MRKGELRERCLESWIFKMKERVEVSLGGLIIWEREKMDEVKNDFLISLLDIDTMGM